MPLGDKNYYKILQVDPAADLEIIVAAYRRLVRKYHPDMNRSPNATRHMQEINAAYEVLKDPARRAQYDKEISSQPSQSDAKYAEERRKREEAEAAWRRAREETETLRRQADEERRRREEAETAQRRAREGTEHAGTDSSGAALATLIIRRRNKRDGAPLESIRIRTRPVGSSRSWEKHGFLDPGDSITIKLKPGHYCVRARVGSNGDRDEEDVEIHMIPNSTVRLVTHAWFGPPRWVWPARMVWGFVRRYRD